VSEPQSNDIRQLPPSDLEGLEAIDPFLGTETVRTTVDVLDFCLANERPFLNVSL
jgi:hypothetical protein